MKTKYILKVNAGEYQANSLFKLFIEVITHRFWHLKTHGKWMD